MYSSATAFSRIITSIFPAFKSKIVFTVLSFGTTVAPLISFASIS